MNIYSSSVVCPSSTYGFLLPLWYFQTFLKLFVTSEFVQLYRDYQENPKSYNKLTVEPRVTSIGLKTLTLERPIDTYKSQIYQRQGSDGDKHNHYSNSI
jgi:hypothetical protein